MAVMIPIDKPDYMKVLECAILLAALIKWVEFQVTH